jgi:hypothetical protein
MALPPLSIFKLQKYTKITSVFQLLTFDFHRHRVNPARIPGMASGYPLEPQPTAFQNAIFINRLV